MDTSSASSHAGPIRSLASYISVLKPRETLLLTFIGLCAAVVAGGGMPPVGTLGLATLAIAMGSAGCNGMTNYLDREVDARMARTRHRALPSGRISPAHRVLPLVLALMAAGLVIAWFLHPLCFLFGVIGVIAATTWRKQITCVFPQGATASVAPVLIGYIAVSQRLDLTILFLCLLIVIWVPLHVWSVMIANREDYLQAGITYFPVSREPRQIVKVLLVLAVLLLGSSVALYFMSDLGLLYLAVAVVLGLLMVFAAVRLLRREGSRGAWRLYKLTAFPYLGVLFLTMVASTWLT
ncbi:MAG: protoheme IX farnesyltransferase [Chloroflexota bacterium]|nr:protoheme IX farnesyltransferase [Chloroflexota bacterium]